MVDPTEGPNPSRSHQELATYQREESRLEGDHTEHEEMGIILTVKIPHREGYELPLDECEDRWLRGMERLLEEIGACRLAWKAASKQEA